MKFGNAHQGVKRIFTAEILGLLASICLTLTLGFVALGVVTVDTKSTGAAIASFGGMAIFGLGAVVLAIISFIIEIIGVSNASKDEGSFKIALYLIIASIVVTVVSGIFSKNETVSGICTVLGDVIRLAITIMIIEGIRHLAAILNDSDMENRGTNLFKVIIVIYALIILARIISLIFSGTGSKVLSGILVFGAGILSIIQYILYLIYLSKARKMLAA